MNDTATSGDPDQAPAAASGGAPGGPGLRTDTEQGRAVRLLLFAAAREAAGTRQADLRGVTVGDVLEQARARFGAGFSSVLDGCRVWVNGDPAEPADHLRDGDEVAVLPPVSGG
jgi:molybdopterin synthase sulfur carrier subunit